ncbi:hypothetical protein [Hymenobacter yonginensis]|uniref:Uncharacterized protein n=1 Tax=Hymenobacter yonginensis TaxID=748197 RepID=A0ABY7PUW5_9BACT|nr:hypothetical protein [Hymenobacter yonginensis]WBO86727.1 hypothetical protein O9Z63_20820 [Hymenobacter yonginensis]
MLTYIQEHDGKWYWYQLDRAVSTTEGLNGRSLRRELDALHAAGLMESQEVAGRLRYFITDNGRQFVATGGNSQQL